MPSSLSITPERFFPTSRSSNSTKVGSDSDFNLHGMYTVLYENLHTHNQYLCGFAITMPPSSGDKPRLLARAN